jgi:hypothetical protein
MLPDRNRAATQARGVPARGKRMINIIDLTIWFCIALIVVLGIGGLFL